MEVLSDLTEFGAESPKIQVPDVKESRVISFPLPENFHNFIECPLSPPHTEQSPSQKYVSCSIISC